GTYIYLDGWTPGFPGGVLYQPGDGSTRRHSSPCSEKNGELTIFRRSGTSLICVATSLSQPWERGFAALTHHFYSARRLPISFHSRRSSCHLTYAPVLGPGLHGRPRVASSSTSATGSRPNATARLSPISTSAGWR